MCSVVSTNPEWTMALQDFHEQNARTRVLQEPMLSLKVPRRFIARAEIEADDARLALKYPGLWNRRPESMDFVAVSAVGFNPTKTRAVVYVLLRDRGIHRFLERQEEKWVRVDSIASRRQRPLQKHACVSRRDLQTVAFAPLP